MLDSDIVKQRKRPELVARAKGERGELYFKEGRKS